MTAVHFSYASDGGAGRAARRASLACQAVGLNSAFVFVAGKRQHDEDICLSPARNSPDERTGMLGDVLEKQVQWGFIPHHRTSISNTLLSIAYPGVDVAQQRIFMAADIIHLHWPTWGITPRTLGRWLEAGCTIFWTLHDCWPMTGGCHYPSGCEQFKTACMKCPQLLNDHGLIANSFDDKLRAYRERGSLNIIAPSTWMADLARASVMFRERPITVVRNPVELDVFAPRTDRTELRSAFGVRPEDLVILYGSYDLAERRKGVRYLIEAVRELATSGQLIEALASGAQVHLAVVGKSSDRPQMPGILPLNVGEVDDDSILADILAIADVTCVPSIEDNYPNVIVEFACLRYALHRDTSGRHAGDGDPW